VLETGDSDLLLLALSDIARARGMAQVAKDAGLGRESLYKALTPGAKPRFDTVMKVMTALGLHMQVQAVHPITKAH
jgi:probable addiction module antidote protein